MKPPVRFILPNYDVFLCGSEDDVRKVRLLIERGESPGYSGLEIEHEGGAIVQYVGMTKERWAKFTEWEREALEERGPSKPQPQESEDQPTVDPPTGPCSPGWCGVHGDYCDGVGSCG